MPQSAPSRGRAHLEQAGGALAQAPQELRRDVGGAALAQARVGEVLRARQRQARAVRGVQRPLPQRLQHGLYLLLRVPLRVTRHACQCLQACSIAACVSGLSCLLQGKAFAAGDPG